MARTNISSMDLKKFVFGICTIWARIILSNAQLAPAVLVFGDSYGDPGNNNYIWTLVRSNFPPYGRNFVGGKPTGRFSDGKIMPDYFVAGLGIKELLPAYLDPEVRDKDLITGVSFASSGSGLDNLTTTTLSVIPMWKQLQYMNKYRARLAVLVGRKNATAIVNKAVTFISIGTNDFIANYFLEPVRPLQFTVAQYQDFLVHTYSSYIEQLYHLDVRRIGIINLPPLGCLPLERTLRFLKDKGGCISEINGAAMGFNSKVAAMTDRLKSQLPGLKIVPLDYYSLVLDYITNPTKYGFEVTKTACCGSGSFELGYFCSFPFPPTCTNASKFVFFDSVHLTQQSYSIISKAFLTGAIRNLF